MKLRFSVLLAALGLSLLICEGALRLTGEYDPRPYPPVCPRPELYQQFEPYGYRLWPSRTTKYDYPKKNPRTLTVVSNKDGFRSSREFDEPDERMRVMVTGDSFVFGEGVEESERFTNVLEAMQPTWRVDNLGMTGFGADLMLRALEQVGLKSHPEVVILTMYTDDFHRVHPQYAAAGFENPRFKLESGQLITIPYPKPRLWDRLSVIVMIKRASWNGIHGESNLNTAILDRFLKLAEVHSFVPALVFLPGQSDTPLDKEHRAWLRQYAERSATPFLDLTEPILRAGPQAFIDDNPHLNPHGHWIVAKKLSSFISTQVLGKHDLASGRGRDSARAAKADWGTSRR